MSGGSPSPLDSTPTSSPSPAVFVMSPHVDEPATLSPGPPPPPRSNLPTPEFGRPVARNGREHQRLKSLLRRNPGGGKGPPQYAQQGSVPSYSSTPSPAPANAPVEEEDDDDEWLLEGTSTNGHVNATVSVGREASNLSRSVDTLSLNESDSVSPVESTAPVVISGKPSASEKRRSKSKSLAKKTSRLFSRNGNSNSNSNSNNEDRQEQLAPPVRHNSVSSAASGDSSRSSKHWSITRVGGGPKGSPPRRTHDPSAQPSSWHPPPSSFALRRMSSSTTDSDSSSIPAPIPRLRNRDSSSHLSASVPTIRNLTTSPTPQQQAQYAQIRQDATVTHRVSAWFSNFIPTGGEMSSPSSQTQPDSPQPSSSPLRKQPSVAASFLGGARNKAAAAARYLMDSEAQPDRCQDTMWVMGLPHPGWTPQSEDIWDDNASTRGEISPPSWTTRIKEGSGTYSSSPPSGGGGRFGNIFSSSFNLAAVAQGDPSTPPPDARTRKEKPKEVLKWPDQFYDDFRTRVWCTYRNQYAPISPLPPGVLLPNPAAFFGAFAAAGDGNLPQPSQLGSGSQSGRLSNGPWGLFKNEGGLTSDSGWGCMLRTGQSVLANALVHLHLGRGWRLPPHRPSTSPETPAELAELEAYATYVRLLSWFLDDPSPLCPFSVHRMALIGKELGKEVGEWFGPSTAAGALKTLVNSFPLSGLSVANAVDGIVYRSDVYAASNISSDEWTPGQGGSLRRSRPSSALNHPGWGGKAVLILIGLRLGLDGVNPIYYDSIKTLFTFPQSVGIAGGRPSSSYYFVASQGNSLFYLDPHTTRQAVPLRTPPQSAAMPFATRRPSTSASNYSEFMEDDVETTSQSSSQSVPQVDVVNVDEDAEVATVSPPRKSSKTRRRLAAVTQPLRIVPDTPPRRRGSVSSAADPSTPTFRSSSRQSVTSPSPARPSATRQSTASSSSSFRSKPSLPVDTQTAWYASAYSEPQLRSYHCDKVKKLPLSGLDPSMLLGFLCADEADFEDFCDRVGKLPQKIFTVQDEPPVWSEDEDGALESVSEPVSEPEDDDELALAGSEQSEDADLDLDVDVDAVDEFGRLPVRSGAMREDTITPSTAGAAGGVAAVAAGLATFVQRTFTPSSSPPAGSPSATSPADKDDDGDDDDDAETTVEVHMTTRREEGTARGLSAALDHPSDRTFGDRARSAFQQRETTPAADVHSTPRSTSPSLPASPKKSASVGSHESDELDQVDVTTASIGTLMEPPKAASRARDTLTPPFLTSSTSDEKTPMATPATTAPVRRVATPVAEREHSAVVFFASAREIQPPNTFTHAADPETIDDEPFLVDRDPEPELEPELDREPEPEAPHTPVKVKASPASFDKPLPASPVLGAIKPKPLPAFPHSQSREELDDEDEEDAEELQEVVSSPALTAISASERYPLVDPDSPFIVPRTIHSRNVSTSSRLSASSQGSIVPPPRSASLVAPTITAATPPAVAAAIEIPASMTPIPRRRVDDGDEDDDDDEDEERDGNGDGEGESFADESFGYARRGGDHHLDHDAVSTPSSAAVFVDHSPDYSTP